MSSNANRMRRYKTYPPFSSISTTRYVPYSVHAGLFMRQQREQERRRQTLTPLIEAHDVPSTSAATAQSSPVAPAALDVENSDTQMALVVRDNDDAVVVVDDSSTSSSQSSSSSSSFELIPESTTRRRIISILLEARQIMRITTAMIVVRTHTKIAMVDESDLGETCIICYSKYKAGEITSTLPCDHMFHRLCVKRWMELKLACPICRQQVVNPNYLTLSSLTYDDSSNASSSSEQGSQIIDLTD